MDEVTEIIHLYLQVVSELNDRLLRSFRSVKEEVEKCRVYLTGRSLMHSQHYPSWNVSNVAEAVSSLDLRTHSNMGFPKFESAFVQSGHPQDLVPVTSALHFVLCPNGRTVAEFSAEPV